MPAPNLIEPNRPAPHPITDPTICGRAPEIIQAIKALEQEFKITILFAVESGSRIMGVAGPDSDFDVRFVFVRPSKQYLSLQQPRDTIERTQGLLDMSGWDLRKALTLMQNSNSALLEWLRSPVIYRDQSGTLTRLNAFASPCINLTTCRLHYLGMATDHLKVISRETEQCAAKNYLYAARGVLSARWIDRRNELPPLTFDELLSILDEPGLRETIALCCKAKTTMGERAKVPKDHNLERYLLIQSNALLVEKPAPQKRSDLQETFSDFFYNSVVCHDF